MLSRIHSKIPVRLVIKLIDVEIDVPIGTDAGAIRPENARVADERVGLAIAVRSRVVEVDCVRLRHELVDKAVVVAFEAVGVAAPLAVVADVAVGVELGGWVAVALAEVGGRYGVEAFGGERGVVNSLAVGGDLDAVKAFQEPAAWPANLLEVERVADVRGDVVLSAQN